MNTTPQLDLVAAARKRLARLRHWRAIARAGGDATASVNRAAWKAEQARGCLRALAKAAAQRNVGSGA